MKIIIDLFSLQHLQEVETKILESMAWESGSPLYDALRRTESVRIHLPPPSPRSVQSYSSLETTSAAQLLAPLNFLHAHSTMIYDVAKVVLTWIRKIYLKYLPNSPSLDKDFCGIFADIYHQCDIFQGAMSRLQLEIHMAAWIHLSLPYQNANQTHWHCSTTRVSEIFTGLRSI